MLSVRKWIINNCKLASYSKDLAFLRDYLSGGIDPVDFAHLIDRFLEEEKGGIPKGYVDEFQYLDDMSQTELEEFKQWLIKNSTTLGIASDTLAPSYLHMEYEKVLPPDTWLVHFSSNAGDIQKKGFEVGHEDVRTLGYTTYFTKGKKEKGWNFALLADSKDAQENASSGKYGKHAILFQAAGVIAYHHGDEENQVIFWGPSARNLIGMYKDGTSWQIDNQQSGRLLYKGSFKEVVNWAISNFQQYKNVITSLPK